MIDVKNLEHFTDVMTFAARESVADKLLTQLAYLSNYGNGPGPAFKPDENVAALAYALTHRNPNGSVCELYPDFAPYSFEFLMLKEDGSKWFNGGLIYSGPGVPLDGSFPALTVGIGIDSSKHGWSIHT